MLHKPHVCPFEKKWWIDWEIHKEVQSIDPLKIVSVNYKYL